MLSRKFLSTGIIGVYLVCLLTLNSYGQAGDGKDRPGTNQASRVPENVIPPAPVLSPEEALKSFKLPPGFEIQIAAAEPYVNSPVAMEFDEQGRMWVVEMTGYMPNADGTGEDARVGSIVTLEDTNGDGRVDKRTVFLDKLQMPRAICLVDGGVLVAEPPNLWFCKDTDGDGKSDVKEVVDDNYGSQVNPEHTSNGLMLALDNWIYSANHSKRYKRHNGQWIIEGTISRGQWGITQDNFGRVYYNSNSDQLRIDLFASHLLSRNANLGRLSGAGFRTTSDQTTWPSRVNPGVNRAYRAGTLRDEDHTLARYTGASGPVIYRGDNFPQDFVNNAFIPEPTGNFVRRNILQDQDGTVSAENAYFQSEFLTSTDERFRPVNLYNGPDGGLYIVDFYRGLIQHRIYLTTYLRKQIESRGLENPTNLGRIYRVVWKGNPLKSSKLASDSSAQLLKGLNSSNGWVRDMSQKLLIEMGEKAPLAKIRRLAINSKNTLTRRHALWTLEGLGGLTPRILTQAMDDWDGKNRAIAVRVSESHLTSGKNTNKLKQKVLSLGKDPAFEARAQVAFSASLLPEKDRVNMLFDMMLYGSSNEWLQNAALTSVSGIEVQLLEKISQSKPWSINRDYRQQFARRVAESLLRSKDGDRFIEGINLALKISESNSRLSQSILAGLTSPLGKDKKPSYKMNIAKMPSGLEEASKSNASLKTLLSRVIWGKDNATSDKPTGPVLSATQKKLFNEGKETYTILCGACHQPNGKGLVGVAPPLEDSEWVSGSTERLIRITLQGVQGPIKVNGKDYNLLMPGLGAALDDQKIAGVLTYVRNSFGHSAKPVSSQDVANVRKATEGTTAMWSAEDLLKIK